MNAVDVLEPEEMGGGLEEGSVVIELRRRLADDGKRILNAVDVLNRRKWVEVWRRGSTLLPPVEGWRIYGPQQGNPLLGSG